MLTLQAIHHDYERAPLLRGIDLHVARGEIVCFLGASGSGKTTLLRIIAGLERPDAGDVRLDGQSILDIPVHERGFGFMFQDFALFPHMTVADNIRFGLRMKRVPRPDQDRRVAEMLELVGLQGFERRDVNLLSGGERQRVALARSLAPNPRLLMLDEPLGSLDAALRERLAVDLRDIIKSVGQTALYVTHDQAEAYAISDRIAILHDGRFEQIGPPQEVYRRPATPFVAAFLGLDNIVPVLRPVAGGVETALGVFPVDRPAASILLHPDGLRLAAPGTPGAIPARLNECTFLGDAYRLELRHDSGLRLTFKHRSLDASAPSRGETVAFTVDPGAVIPLAAAPDEQR